MPRPKDPPQRFKLATIEYEIFNVSGYSKPYMWEIRIVFPFHANMLMAEGHAVSVRGCARQANLALRSICKLPTPKVTIIK